MAITDGTFEGIKDAVPVVEAVRCVAWLRDHPMRRAHLTRTGEYAEGDVMTTYLDQPEHKRIKEIEYGAFSRCYTRTYSYKYAKRHIAHLLGRGYVMRYEDIAKARAERARAESQG